MGTHGAFGVTWPNGGHNCVERPMDGSGVMDTLDSMAQDIRYKRLKSFAKLQYTSPTFGSGSVQQDDREHDQAYFLYIDFPAKTIGSTYLLEALQDTEWGASDEWKDKVRRFIALAKRHGWTVVSAYDCPTKFHKELQ